MTREPYEKNGKKYDHVTEIIDYFKPPHLVNWMIKNKDYEEIGEKAMSIGSRVDELCFKSWKELVLISKDEPKEVVSAMEAYTKWQIDYSDIFNDIQAMQETVYYDDLGVAGTLDIRTSNAIIDIKVSKSVRHANWIQVGMYNRKFKLPKLYILRLSKETGNYSFVECPYPQEYLEELFMGRLVNYRYEKEGIA